MLFDKNVLGDDPDFLEALNREPKRRREAELKKRGPFNLSCSAVDGKWGIWLQIADEMLLVKVIDLVNSIYRDDTYAMLSLPGDSKLGSFVVDVTKKEYCYQWSLSHYLLDFSSENMIPQEEYTAKIYDAVSLLYEAVLAGKELAYEESRDTEKEVFVSCYQQLSVKCTWPQDVRRAAKDIQVEEFVFDVIPDNDGEDFTMGISDRVYAPGFTHWDGDLERIRHQLESYTYAYDDEAKVRINFDSSETIVTMRDKRFVDEVKEVGPGVTYKYKTYTIVSISPNEFIHRPIFKGYCDPEQFLRTFYTGWLLLALDHPDEAEYEIPDKINAYNMIKSPLIEDHLTGRYWDREETLYSTRQVVVKHVITINPDVGQLFYDKRGMAYEADREGVLELVYDREGKPIRMEDFVAWHGEIKQVGSKSMDWEEYHRRGMRLAEELRKVLSPDFDLWYTAPCEDTSGTIKRPILVLEPYTSRWPQDTSPEDDTQVVDEV